MLCSLLINVVAFASGAAFQMQPPSEYSESADDIIVTAPEEQKTRRTQMRRMAQEILRKPRSGRATARYLQQLCPEIRGLPEQDALQMGASMLRLGAEVGIRFRQRENCTPNAVIAFIPPKEGPAKTWLTPKSRALKHLLSYQRLEVMNERGPVRAWNVSLVRSADGGPLPSGNGRSVTDVADFGNRVRLASGINLLATNEIAYSLVLIELEAANGKSFEQLAAYALMRLAAGVRLPPGDQVSTAETILTLFDDYDEAPESLSDFDRALLTRLYATPANWRPQRLLGSIATRALEHEIATTSLGE